MTTVSTFLRDRVEDVECDQSLRNGEFELCEDEERSQACPVVDESLVSELIHDIRNTLGAVAVLSDLTLIDLPENSSVRGMAYEVQQACREASAQCQRVLAAFRGLPARTEPTELSALIREVTPLLATGVPTSSVLRLNLANDLPLLSLAPGEIRQVVMNLVKNAGAAVRDRPGVVTVTTGWIAPRAADVGDVDGRGVMRSSRQAYLAVSDTGCGIAESTCSGLRAGRSNNNADGHGLGLASVRRIVAFHGAHLQLHTRLGCGTTVRIVFEGRPPVASLSLSDTDPDVWSRRRSRPAVQSRQGLQPAQSATSGRNTPTLLTLRSAESASGDTTL